MGGHAGGEYASQIAVSTIEDHIINHLQKVANGDAAAETKSAKNHPITEGLKRAIKIAGDQIYFKASATPELKGMGTTTVAMMLDGKAVYVAYVGDSRVYMLREHKLEQITEDHSLVNEQVKAGLISPEDAKNHQLKNIITRSVGFQEEVEIDTVIRDVQTGDRFLLCSDGLSNFLEVNEICDLLGKRELQDAAQDLVIQPFNAAATTISRSSLWKFLTISF